MAEFETDLPEGRIQQILKYVIELLWFSPDGLFTSEIFKYLRETISFSSLESSPYPFAPFIPRYEAVVRVGTTPMVKAGWMEKTKNGRWYITNEGRKAFNQYHDANSFFEASIKIFHEWKLKESGRIAQFNVNPFLQADELAWSQIKQYFELLDIRDIRTIVASLLKALGCHIESIVPYMKEDNLIDLVCTLDPLGFKKPRLVVHISNNNVVSSSDDIARFASFLNPEDIGLFVSFGGFDQPKYEYVSDKTSVVRRIDLAGFVELWKQNYNKIDREGQDKLPLLPVYFLSLPNNQASLPGKFLPEFKG